VGLSAAVVATVVVIRLLWVFPATYVPRWLISSIGRRDPAPPRRIVLVLGWAGMRGAVSLAAALALPASVPQRDLLVVLAFAVIMATLVGQGLTLPLLIRRLGIGDDGSVEAEERHAREAATQAALSRLEEVATEVPGHLPLIGQLRDRYAHRAEHYVSGRDTESEADTEEREHEEIRREVLRAERVAVIGLRDSGVIGDEALRRVERDLDLENLRRDI
jgi:CPA1 family monovalent cation:H+ antiporter